MHTASNNSHTKVHIPHWNGQLQGCFYFTQASCIDIDINFLVKVFDIDNSLLLVIDK